MNQTRFRENQRPLIMKPKRVPPKRLYRFNRNALILLRVIFSKSSLVERYQIEAMKPKGVPPKRLYLS